MKKTFLVFALACAFAVCTHISEAALARYSELDSAITAATEINLKSAALRRDFPREKERLRAMRESLAAVRDSKKRLLENLKAADEKTLSECSAISAKISADEAALARLSAFLDKIADSLCADPKIKKIIADAASLPKDFRALSADEKMRSLAAIFAVLRVADSRLVRSGNTVSTGIFAKASGECADGVAVLRVLERNTANEK